MSIVVSVENLGKKYVIAHQAQERHATLRDALRGQAERFSRVLAGREPPPAATLEDFWALKAVSFEVRDGDRVGIIGRNGAGKSTLFKILSRITEPTTGRARIKGRIASLLEVGTGFHPELTGRENVYLNGATLGMGKDEIARKFDEIVAFSGVEKFLDTPVKRYSTGMYMRLAFAVAAHLEPDILVVDEVLSVGDAQFQKKCLGKMQDVGKEGRTVLFVSHSMQTVHALCTSAILLTEGRIECSGDVGTVVNSYLSTGNPRSSERVWDDPQTAPGNHQIRLHSARVVPEADTEGGLITIRTPFRLECVFSNHVPESEFYVGMHFKTALGDRVFVTALIPRTVPHGVYRVACHIPGDLLNSGSYSTDWYFVRDANAVMFDALDLLSVDVHDVAREPGAWLGEIPGAVRPRLQWDLDPAETAKREV